jgi:hypothetical protein
MKWISFLATGDFIPCQPAISFLASWRFHSCQPGISFLSTGNVIPASQ